MNPTIPSLPLPFSIFSWAVSRLAVPGLPSKPAPGLTMFATIIPRAKQTVVIAKK